jgi:energy-coupling factor transport system permease protein
MTQNRLSIGTYIHRNSFLHRLDPRTKWIITLLLAVDIYRVKSFPSLIPIAFLIILGILLAQTRMHEVRNALRPIFPLMALMAVIHICFDQGHAVYIAGPIQVTREGLYTAGLTSLQFALLFLAAALLGWTTVPTELASGLERMFTPLKRLGIPVHAIAMTVALAYRFFPILTREWHRIKLAQMARGANLEHGSFIRRMRHLASLVIPLLIHTFERAEELSIAMDARAYRGDIGRTHYYRRSLRRMDVISLIVSLILSISLFWFQKI